MNNANGARIFLFKIVQNGVTHLSMPVNVKLWKYNIRRNNNSDFSIVTNNNSDFSIVTTRRVAIIFFELRILKNFMQKF